MVLEKIKASFDVWLKSLMLSLFEFVCHSLCFLPRQVYSRDPTHFHCIVPLLIVDPSATIVRNNVIHWERRGKWGWPCDKVICLGQSSVVEYWPSVVQSLSFFTQPSINGEPLWSKKWMSPTSSCSVCSGYLVACKLCSMPSSQTCKDSSRDGGGFQFPSVASFDTTWTCRGSYRDGVGLEFPSAASIATSCCAMPF